MLPSEPWSLTTRRGPDPAAWRWTDLDQPATAQRASRRLPNARRVIGRGFIAFGRLVAGETARPAIAGKGR
jgi:hypothetical protein